MLEVVGFILGSAVVFILAIVVYSVGRGLVLGKEDSQTAKERSGDKGAFAFSRVSV